MFMANKKFTSIGTYTIHETIRETPEWTLVKATEPDSNHPVMIKIYFPTLNWPDELLNDFFDRLGYLKFIEHENLLEIKDFGKILNAPYVVYPFQTLYFSQLNATSHLNQDEFLYKYEKIAEALDYLHRQEIIHGLLCSDTIFVDGANEIKLIDYGISDILKKVLVDKVENNLAFLSLSNSQYSAPELLLGGNPTRQSDIYSYGLLFCYGIFGELPFVGKTAPQTAFLHIKNDPTWIKYVTRYLSKDSILILKKSLHSKPEYRFKSIQDIINLIGRIKNSNAKNKIIKTEITRYPSGHFPEKVSPGQGQVDAQQDNDWDKTVDHDDDVYQELPKPASRRNWIFLTIIVIILASLSVVFSIYNFKRTPSEVQKQQINTAVAPINDTLVKNLPPTSISQTTNVPIQPTIAAIQDQQQPILPSKPSLENQLPEIPSELISPKNITQLMEFSRLGYGRPEDVDISSDSNYVAIASSAGVVIFTNNTFVKWIDTGNWATSIQFSPDATLLAIGLKNGQIQIWDWQQEEMLFHLDGHSAKITRLIFSKNGRHLFSASNDQNFIEWDLKSQKQAQPPYHAHSMPIEDIAVTPDERILVTGAGDQSVRVWDLASRKLVWDIPFQGKVQAVAISSDGEFIAAGGDGGMLRQWNLRTRQQRTDAIPIKQRIWKIQYIDDDKSLFVSLDNGQSRIFVASQVKYPGISTDFTMEPIDAELIKSFGSDFRPKSYSLPYRNSNTSVSIIWSGEVDSRGLILAPPVFDNLDQVVFSQDGKIVAAGGKRGFTSVWNIMKNQIIYREKAGLPPGQPISPDSASIAVIIPTIINTPSLGNEPVINNIYRLINLENGGKKGDLSEAIPSGVVSYSEDGKLFISGSSSRSKAWDYESNYEIYFNTARNNGCWITSSANDGTIFQWYSIAGVFLDSNKERAGAICRNSSYLVGNLIGLSHDLNVMAYVKTSGLLEARDLNKDTVMWTNSNHKEITSIAVSPNGSIISIGTADGKLIFINAETGNDLFEITGNYGSVQSIAFTENGDIVATAGSDGTVRLFGIYPRK